MYYTQFERWLSAIAVDWVFAINMTVPDAVPATAALHAAAERYFTKKQSGGVVFWDHDLFGSYAVRDRDSGVRMYPCEPNELTPLPKANRYTRWIVVSPELAKEASGYPTNLAPTVVPNVLPNFRDVSLGTRHREFISQHGFEDSRSILLNPVRVFHTKGVELSVRLLAEMKEIAKLGLTRCPYLLVFGSLDEEPQYAREVVSLADKLGVSDDIIFLNGVPLTSNRSSGGWWQFDESDLMLIAASTCGGIVFTPNVPDVESVGLGPGLASLAELPFLVTHYDAFNSVYESSIACTHMDPTSAGITAAAAEFLGIIDRFKSNDPELRHLFRKNRSLVEQRFPDDGWRRLWYQLSQSVGDHTSP